jgi:hypothetical protein
MFNLQTRLCLEHVTLVHLKITLELPLRPSQNYSLRWMEPGQDILQLNCHAVKRAQARPVRMPPVGAAAVRA